MTGSQIRTARILERIQGRPALMGILNCTPDSFSDGGLFLNPEKALDHARRLIHEGADILDIGGESTRPFSIPVSAEEESRRVLPLIRALRQENNVPISIDTHKAAVAKKAIEAGADMVNDITALNDPEMLGLCADTGVWVVLMHMQGNPRTMQENPSYRNVVQEVFFFLKGRIERALKGGIAADRILVDPGIGFGKTLEDNLKLLAALEDFRVLGFPLLLGTSRKRFLRMLLTRGEKEPDVLSEEVGAGTLATTVLAAKAGVAVLRVHDVATSRAALDVTRAILGAQT